MVKRNSRSHNSSPEKVTELCMKLNFPSREDLFHAIVEGCVGGEEGLQDEICRFLINIK